MVQRDDVARYAVLRSTRRGVILWRGASPSKRWRGARPLTSQPGLSWPQEVFSLTHVALPFAPDDPLYGIDGAGAIAGLLPIGRLSPRGERAVLTVGTDTLMRLSSNPFFPFVAERIGQWLDGAAPTPRIIPTASPH